MGQKNRRDSRGRFAKPIISPMSPETVPPKLLSVSIKHPENNPAGIIIEETDIGTTQTFGQNLGEVLDQAITETPNVDKFTNKTKEVTMNNETVKKEEVVETATTVNNETAKVPAPAEQKAADPQKKAEEKKEAAPAPAEQEAPKKEETPIASGDTKGTGKQDLRKALQEQKPETASREVVIHEEYNTGRAMLHNFGVGLAIGGGMVLGVAIASGIVNLVKRKFGGNDEVTE